MSIERMNSRMDSAVEKRFFIDAKVGATAGWTVNSNVDTSMHTCAAGNSGATLVVPLPGLKDGDRIIGYHLLGQIQSVGGAVTLDADIRRGTPAAAASTFAAAAGTGMTQISVTAQTAITKTNSRKILESVDYVVVSEDNSYYALITGDTAASTDIEFLGLVLYVTPAR